MQQYLFKGRGAPDTIPQAPMLLYRDLDTNEFYFSRGNSYVSDWGTPMIDKAALQAILNSFDPYAGGPPPREVIKLNVRQPEENGPRIVEINPSYNQHGGRFIWIEDPYLSNERTTLSFEEEEGQVVRPLEEITIFNNTDGPLRISNTEANMIYFAWPTDAYVRRQGVVTMKMLEDNNEGTRRWVVWGDLEAMPT